MSDEVLRALFRDVEAFHRASLFKGWFFVLATTWMLYALVSRFGKGIAGNRRELDESADRLRESEKKTSDILGTLPGLVFIKDKEARYTFANDATCEFMGRSQDEVLGKKDFEIFDEATAEVVAAQDEMVLQGRQIILRENTYTVAATGTVGTFLSKKVPLYGPDGEVCGLCGVATDVTEVRYQGLALEESEARLQLALKSSRMMVWELDTQSGIVVRTGTSEEIIGLPAGLGRIQDFKEVIHEDDLEAAMAKLHEAVANGQDLDHTFRIRCRGEVRWIHLNAKVVERERRSTVMVGTLLDVTERTGRELELRQQEEQFRTVIESSPNGILLLDSDGVVCRVNREAEAIFGYSREELVGLPIVKLVPKRLAKLHSKIIRAFQEHQGTPQIGSGLEMVGVKKSGDELHLEVGLSPVVGPDNELMTIATFVDVSAKWVAQERIRRMALFDDLTSLPNRHGFLRDLDEAITSGRPFGLALIDIDRFRDLNECFGHDRGDTVIRELVTRMTSCLGKGDVLARVGGDEFAILAFAAGTHADDMEKLTGKIRRATDVPVDSDGTPIFVNLSIGTCQFPSNAETSLQLLQCLDIALFEAKQHGRGSSVQYSVQLGAREKARLSAELALREAVEKEQFTLYYQPIVDLVTGKPIGAEALVRWIHPELGLIRPDLFIAMAEETNLIVPLGRWIMRTACKQAKPWSDGRAGNFKLSVNISPKQFADPNLVRHMREAIELSGFPSTALQLEITEGVLMGNPKDAATTLRELKESGAMVAVDDFGTGYSSLGYLHTYPVDCLKVDQSFVRGVLDDQGSATICQAIINLAQNLGMSVVAEGVETTDHEAFLKGLGCEMAQGYLYSKPLSPEEFEAYLAGQIDEPSVAA